MRTGEALRGPALDPIPCWGVERVGEMVYVREKQVAPAGERRGRLPVEDRPFSVVIVGGGGAGLAAADMLRRRGYDGSLTMLSADDSPPCDRPNLSKDYLAGTAKDDWIPLRPAEFYTDRRIDLVLNARVASLDARHKRVRSRTGRRRLRRTAARHRGRARALGHSRGDGRSCTTCGLRRQQGDRRPGIVGEAVVVVGASFIGLEVAASLRAREIAVHVVAPGSQPLERVMGPELGRLIRRLHEEHGVVFHLGRTVGRVEGRVVRLSDGTAIDADFIVLGVGVRPRSGSRKGQASRSTAGYREQHLETAPLVSSRRATLRGGPTLAPAIGSVSSTGSSPNARAKQPPETCLAPGAIRWGALLLEPALRRHDQLRRSRGEVGPVDVDGSLEGRDCAVTYKGGGRTLAVATSRATWSACRRRRCWRAPAELVSLLNAKTVDV